MSYVWYVGYASNLHEERLLCYIEGGKPRFGNRRNKGCADRTHPLEDRAVSLSYPLYFALPGSIGETRNWGAGGVAFIDPRKKTGPGTICRMWKITEAQYCELRAQEGDWYNLVMEVGEAGGFPMLTITHEAALANLLCPSDAYIKTIALGLRQTCGLTLEEIADYLLDKPGIRESIEREALTKTLMPLKEIEA